jgi:hypothetical protein
MRRFLWLEDAPPDELRAGIRAALAGSPAGLEAQEDAAREFLRRLGALGFSGVDAALLDETAPRLEAVRAGLVGAALALKSFLYGDWVTGTEWREAAERRSALQFLHDLYAGRAGAVLADVELDPLDDLLEQRAEREGFVLDDHVPAGAPESHWWWWPS